MHQLRVAEALSFAEMPFRWVSADYAGDPPDSVIV
jgi:hypothetical protein